MAAGLLVAAHGLVFAVVDSWSSSAFSPSWPHGGNIREVTNRRSLASRNSRRPSEPTYSTRSILQCRLHGCASVGPSAGWSVAHRDHPVAPPLAMSLTPASGAGAGEELSTELVVVRHGETAWNASRIVQGQLDPELNEAGRQQAVMVAGRLSSEAKPAAVYSSDLRRAAETAEIIAGVCGVSNVMLNEALRERHMGYLQGLTWDDAKALAKSSDSFKGYDIFKITEGSDPDSRNQELPGGGESMNQMNERCVSYLNRIAQQHIGERVVVVSHVLTILGLCRHTNPLNNITNKDIPNTSLNIFRVCGITGQWTLERRGDVRHLEGN